MTPEEYAARQAVISAAVASYTAQFATVFSRPALTVTGWLGLLELLFPEIARRYEESAFLARVFYDSQREQNHPDIPRNERLLEELRFEELVADMEPTRQRLSRADAPQDAVAAVALRAVREVENAGRRQIIHAVENDPEADIIRGWARVATGRETCAWCLMLISRGPVYESAESSGLDLDNEEASRMIAAGEDVSEHMTEWHTGCDCKVVPVFKTESWPGQEAADRALQLWIDATREARQILEDNPDKTSYVDGHWIPTTLNREAINTLRRRLERGDISNTEWAALAAA